MQTLMMPDPALAKEYFEQKLSFTTGPVELDRMIKSGEDIIVIDVREREDYLKGHIPGALSLPKDEWGSLKGLSKDKTNILYCYTAVCHLAATAAVEFAGKGFPIMELDGGFEEWKENDLDVEGESVNRLLKQTKDKFLHRRH
jgi:rhodanese-related sulfurtransferase